VVDRRRVNFYEAGSGQEVIRVDWFTLLFKVTRISHRGGALLFVASVNGATKLILNHEVCPQVDARAFRHLNHFRTFSFPTLTLTASLDAASDSITAADRSFPPGPHLRDRWSL
jgi:hypothetical protein